jgi:O-antigen/teichoic acid export membrane protein
MHASLLISLLVIGNALNGLMHMPYALQLAHGWTRLAFIQNAVAVILLAPAIYFATLRWGAVGAAGVWIFLNSGYLLISAQVMYRRLLVAEKSRWYVNDVGKVLLAVLIVTGVARGVMMGDFGDMVKVLILAVTLVISTAVAIVSAETLRKYLSFKHFLRVR